MPGALARSILESARMLGAEQLRSFIGRYFVEAGGALAAKGRWRRLPANRGAVFVPDCILAPASSLAIGRVVADLRLGLREGRGGKEGGIFLAPVSSVRRPSDRRPSCRLCLTYRDGAPPKMVATVQQRLASPFGAAAKPS